MKGVWFKGRRDVALIAASILIFSGIGLVAAMALLMHDRDHFDRSLLTFLARYSDQTAVPALTRESAIALMRKANKEAEFPNDVELVDEQQAQRLIGPKGKLPTKPYEIIEYGGGFLEFGGKLIRFPDHDGRYLSMNFRPDASPLQRLFQPNVIVLLMAICTAILCATVLLYYSLRTKAHLAATIFADIRSGNLKARFPLTRMDDVGLLMGEFNKMADEIERLVETIRNAEVTRMRRLQELAHDLRTPVASLKTLLETLQEHHQTMPTEKKAEVLSLSLREVDYFARLVEDVLFLAQVSEPKYAPVNTEVDLSELLADKLEFMKARYPDIKIVANFPESAITRGDRHLLQRLFRNAFENAFSFAQSTIAVAIRRRGAYFVVSIQDDGQGFSETALSNFGERRATRSFDAARGRRLSVGLGSMIMKAVVHVHGGTIAARNRIGDNHVLGAELEVTLNSGGMSTQG